MILSAFVHYIMRLSFEADVMILAERGEETEEAMKGGVLNPLSCTHQNVTGMGSCFLLLPLPPLLPQLLRRLYRVCCMHIRRGCTVQRSTRRLYQGTTGQTLKQSVRCTTQTPEPSYTV